MGRRLRRLTALAGLALLTGCGSAPIHHGLSLRVDTNPFRLSVVSDGKVVVAEDRSSRLRYQLTSTGAQHRLTKVAASRAGTYQVATDEPGRTATVTVVRTARGFRVSLRLHPATNVEQLYDAFTAQPDEHYLGGGERADAVDLRGRIVPVKVSYACSSAPVPYFASSVGWALRLATENVAGFAFPGSSGGAGCRFGSDPQCTFPALSTRTEVCVRGARLDEDLYVGSFAQTLRAYEADTGEPAVAPRSELELVKWRDVVNKPADVFDDIARLRAARIPIGWVLLDNPWEPCVGQLTFDTRRIPDPPGLIRKVHALGLKFMLWVSPKVVCGNGYPAAGLIGPPGNQVLDLTKPAVVAEYLARLRKVFALGVDGVKGDRGDEADLEPRGAGLQNEYPLLYARAVLGVLPRDSGSIFRAATAGSQRVLPGLWAGDQSGDFAGLQAAIRLGETAAASGFPVWGSDVGGYSSAGLTAEVFARWAQLGAISPVLEVGGAGPNATPWTLGPEAMTALRGAAVLHYELFPYLYGLLERREPVLRPLAYDFPRNSGAWKAEFELMVGPSLLAAPVVGPGATPSVRLPPGSWIDLYSGRRVDGPAVFTRETPLDQFPLYLRAGAVVPFNLRTADSWWGVDELTHPGRAGYLVASGVRLDLHGQPHGVQLFVPAASRPRQVTLAGRPVPWRWNAGPFPGTVVRVHGPTVAGEIVLSAT